MTPALVGLLLLAGPLARPVDVWAHCLVVHVELVEKLNEYPQTIDRVTVIEFCRTRDGLELRERVALQVDGKITRGTLGVVVTTLWALKLAPAPARIPLADRLRGTE